MASLIVTDVGRFSAADARSAHLEAHRWRSYSSNEGRAGHETQAKQMHRQADNARGQIEYHRGNASVWPANASPSIDYTLVIRSLSTDSLFTAPPLPLKLSLSERWHCMSQIAYGRYLV